MGTRLHRIKERRDVDVAYERGTVVFDDHRVLI